jgi:hypothetical protein
LATNILPRLPLPAPSDYQRKADEIHPETRNHLIEA